MRDSAFTIYAFLCLSFMEEADAYLEWLSSLLKNRNEDGSLQIRYTIYGQEEHH
jgi:GH15 family glucan-1,4-alpha-glucosidase